MRAPVAEGKIGPLTVQRKPMGGYRRAEAALWAHYGMAPGERMVELESLRIRVQEVGSGRPVLLIHGGPNAGSTFAALVAGLRERRCLVMDRPGCGLSGPVAYGRLPLPRLAAATLAELLDRLEVGEVDLLGSSFGGAWALWLAAAHPERVRRLVLLGAPAFVPGMRIPGFMRMMGMPLLGELIARMPPSASGTKWVYRQMGHGAPVVEEVIPPAYWEWSVRLMAETATMASDSGVIRRVLRQRASYAEVELTPGQLRSIAAPTLLYWGDADTFGGADLARSTAGLIPRAELAIEAGAGHLPWLDAPERAAARVLEFLDA